MNQGTQNPSAGLAIMGRRAPWFSSPLHVGCPNVANTERFFQRMTGAFESRKLTNAGPLALEFESKIARYLGVKHCIATCNATIGLDIAIRAMDLGGEVIVPSFTFIATVHALQWRNITPVFCDVAPGTHHVDPAQVEKLVTPQTTGILALHTWGIPCDVDALADIAQRHRLSLLFDAAHAMGCSYKSRMIGNFGRAEVFSFHATKLINCFEGGAITTNDDELAARMRLMTNFGFAGVDSVVACGTNGKMHEASAAMGLSNLEAIEDFIAVNRRNFELYRDELASIPGIRLVSHEPGESERRTLHYIVVEVDPQIAGISRDRLVDVLWAENVLARRYFHPGCHNAEPYHSLNPAADLALTNTRALCQNVLVLPTGTSIDGEAIRGISRIIRTAIAHREALHASAPNNSRSPLPVK
jgi:dTDP-4-amino-4,6-dideoxygalactose transaminase